MDTLYTMPQLCPLCGYTLDGHTNTTGKGGPSAGDFTICMACTGVLRYGQGLKVYAIGPEDIPEECRAQIEKVVDAIRTLRTRQPEWRPYPPANS